MDRESSTLSTHTTPLGASTKPGVAAGEINGSWQFPDELKAAVGRNYTLAQELIAAFVTDATSRLHALGSALMGQDFKSVRMQAHSLKGAASQMGASGFASLCAALESCDGSQTALDTLVIQQLREEFTVIRAAMERYLAGLRHPDPESDLSFRETAK